MHYPTLTSGHAINAAAGNFFMPTGETRGHLQKKRRGKEKRKEEERERVLEDYFWRCHAPRLPDLG